MNVKIKLHFWISLIFINCTFGCASKAFLTISSQPYGAYITEVETGKSFGLAPVTVFYDPTTLVQHKIAGTNNCYLVKGFEARWVSGSMTTLNPIQLCGGTTDRYTISLNRSPSSPGIEKDLQFALQAQALRAQQQQAQAASDAAFASLLSAILSPANTRPVNCTSTQIGQSLQTNCW